MVKAKQICPPPCLRIDLGRESARTPYVLSLVEEETILNPALQANLFNDFNIKLPEIPVDKLAMAFHAGPNPMLGLGFVVASLVLGHMLRHTCGFSLANQGYDLRLIQDYPGHHDSQHTVQHYTRVAGVRFGGSGGGR